jgi:hypothetical protein
LGNPEEFLFRAPQLLREPDIGWISLEATGQQLASGAKRFIALIFAV